MPGFAGCSCRLNLASRAVCFITTAVEHRPWRVNPSVCADALCEAEAVERAGGGGGGGGGGGRTQEHLLVQGPVVWSRVTRGSSTVPYSDYRNPVLPG